MLLAIRAELRVSRLVIVSAAPFRRRNDACADSALAKILAHNPQSCSDFRTIGPHASAARCPRSSCRLGRQPLPHLGRDLERAQPGGVIVDLPRCHQLVRVGLGDQRL